MYCGISRVSTCHSPIAYKFLPFHMQNKYLAIHVHDFNILIWLGFILEHFVRSEFLFLSNK